MSVITRATTLTQDEIQGVDETVGLVKILSNDHELNDTMNDNIQCATEEVCQSNRPNATDIHEANGSDIADNNQQKNNVTNYEISANEDPDFPPMISTQGKLPGSTRYIWAGYVYARDGYTRSFRCSNRHLYDCPGRAIIKNGEVKETKAHSHPREPHILQVEQIKQDMITRALEDKSVGLRTIYLDACKTEPLVRTHLGLDMMLNKMQKARNGRSSSSSSKPRVKPKKKKPDFNFDWAKDWLEVPAGQDNIALCKICAKEIVSPTKIRVYNHFLSKIHKRAVLGLYRPPNKRFETEKPNSSSIDPESATKGERSDPDSEQEETYAIEVLDQFQDEVDRMEATKRSKKRKIVDYSEFYEQVIELQTSSGHQAPAENHLKISNGQKPESQPKIKLSRNASRAATISVHVWDSNTGQPTAGLKISLHKQRDDSWSFVCWILTDQRGKCCDLLYGEDLTTGLYKLNLDTRDYYSKLKQRCLYPYIEIVFEVQNANELYHFPVQLSPSAYNPILYTSLKEVETWGCNFPMEKHH